MNKNQKNPRPVQRRGRSEEMADKGKTTACHRGIGARSSPGRIGGLTQPIAEMNGHESKYRRAAPNPRNTRHFHHSGFAAHSQDAHCNSPAGAWGAAQNDFSQCWYALYSDWESTSEPADSTHSLTNSTSVWIVLMPPRPLLLKRHRINQECGDHRRAGLLCGGLQ